MILNGYYLFVYSEIDPVLNVLGKSRRHDHCLSVFYKNDMDITLICHHEFERYSGFKHHNIAFYSKEDLTADAIVRHNMKVVPKGSVLVSFKLTVGRVAITGIDMCTNEAIGRDIY